MQIKLYNSLTRTIEKFTPVHSGEVRMYSCGPTVYNFAHIGNMRAFLFADLLQRVMRVIGQFDVRWVMNITDIDDKTIRDSAKDSEAWSPELGDHSDDPMTDLRRFTDYYQKSFIEDISDLGININHFYAMPRATDYIEQMKDLIKTIYDKGYAYIADGSVYFNVDKWRDDDLYGKLYKIDFENFRTGERIDADQYEREQANDFALWKARKPNEPYWEFNLDGINCDGRPGWHIECSCMEAELLGLPFDIHTGGIDLKFPHHEDEIAQSKAGYGVEPTVYWCHNEFLEVEGEKMSKSLGNFYTLRDLLNKGLDPLDIRFAMLSTHYGSKCNFTFDGISASHKARMRVQEFIYDLVECNAEGKTIADTDNLRNEIYSELANDLHTPKALGKLFTFINNNPAQSLDQKSAVKVLELMEQLNHIFAVWQISERQDCINIIPDNIVELAELRMAARREKNYDESDRLREAIADAGYIIKDTKDSYELEKISS